MKQVIKFYAIQHVLSMNIFNPIMECPIFLSKFHGKLLFNNHLMTHKNGKCHRFTTSVDVMSGFSGPEL